jgi:DNA polymerase-3 subunit alpha
VNTLDFKIKSISLLNEEKDNLVKKLRISVPINELTEAFIAEMLVLFEKYPGRAAVQFEIVDDMNGNVSLNLFSKKQRIEVNQKIIDIIGDLQNIYFSIN